MRIDRPIGYLLLFLPTSFGLLYANHFSTNLLFYLLLFYIGALLMRGAGCIINDLIDKKLDNLVTRTQLRPLASGNMKVFEAILLLLILLIIGFIILIQFNLQVILIGISIMPMIVLYPFSKRFFIFPQLVLGIVFNWGVFVGYMVSEQNLSSGVIFLYLSCVMWTLIYDTVYAVQDIHDDKKLNLYSTAIFFENYLKHFLVFIMILQYSFLYIAGLKALFHISYYIMIIFLFIVNLIDLLLIWKPTSQKSLKYFQRNKNYGFIILLSIAIGINI